MPAPIVTVKPPCKPQLSIKFSGHPKTMHISNQHPSYTPPRTAVWNASGAEHGVRSGGVEGYGPSRLELFLGGGRKKMRRTIWTKMTRLRRLTSQTLVNRPRSSAHGYFHPYRKPKHPTNTRGHSTTTSFCQGPLYTLPAVQPRILLLCLQDPSVRFRIITNRTSNHFMSKPRHGTLHQSLCAVPNQFMSTKATFRNSPPSFLVFQLKLIPVTF